MRSGFAPRDRPAWDGRSPLPAPTLVTGGRGKNSNRPFRSKRRQRANRGAPGYPSARAPWPGATQYRGPAKGSDSGNRSGARPRQTCCARRRRWRLHRGPNPEGFPARGCAPALIIPHSALNIAEGRCHRLFGHVGRHPHFANAFRQNPMDFPSHGFLIARQESQNLFFAEAANWRQRAQPTAPGGRCVCRRRDQARPRVPPGE